MERNTLMAKCYPRIKDYCREKHGLEFQVRGTIHKLSIKIKNEKFHKNKLFDSEKAEKFSLETVNNKSDTKWYHDPLNYTSSKYKSIIG